MTVVRARPYIRRGARGVHLREVLHDSLWFRPAVFTAIAIVAAFAVNRYDAYALDSGSGWFLRNVDDARTLVSTIAVSLLTFLAVVFSITIVVLQLASSQYSPRVLRRFIRNRWTQSTLALFMATFVFCLQILASIKSERVVGEGRLVPALGSFLCQVLALACLLLFMIFVHEIIRSLRVSALIDKIARETREALDDGFPPTSAYVEVEAPEGLDDHDVTATIGITSVGVIRGLEIDRLIDLATAHGCVVRLRHMVGDYIAADEPVAEQIGGTPLRARDLTRCFDIGVERSFYQDAPYGFRQLVDIAIKALSPAINDPTTAVQVTDRLVDLLRRVATRPAPSGIYLGADGAVRLVRPMPDWNALVALAFTEIRRYGAESPQISRRLQAAFADLERSAPADGVGAVQHQQRLLCQRIEQAIADPTERAHALEPDPRGLG